MNVLLPGDFVFTNFKFLLSVTLTRVYARFLFRTGNVSVKCCRVLKLGTRKDLWEICSFFTGTRSYRVLCLRQVMKYVYWTQASDLLLI